MSAPVLLSVEEAAARLGLAVGTVRHWVSQRRITCIKVGRRCRIPEAEVARILEAGTVLAGISFRRPRWLRRAPG